MATTWMKAIHKSGGVAAALDRSIGYAMNPEKTNSGDFVQGFACSPATAASEFLLSKRQYEQQTGRNQGKHDVVVYSLRMSFKPGEVTPAQALELGRELAMRWTKGKHQFIVAAHTNTKNPHTHIVFNSVNLDCDGKYQDFKRSAIALRRVSDQICLEHGLSIIEHPGLSKGFNRHEYLGEAKPLTVRDQLRDLMDSVLIGVIGEQECQEDTGTATLRLREAKSVSVTCPTSPACKDFNSFLAGLQAKGVELKRGKQLAFKLPGAKKFVRQDTLGEDYSETAILERISGKRIIATKEKSHTPEQNPVTLEREKAVPADIPPKPNLLIDIQSKMQQGYGEGYRRWAVGFNLKEASKTLIFLKENGVSDYSELVKIERAASHDFNSRGDRLKEIETRQKEISELQKQIGTYGRTRDIYAKYKGTKFDRGFYDIHATDIILHKSAKKYFDELGLKKLPSINTLKQEWATLESERRTLYSGYKQSRENMIAWASAKYNADRILGEPAEPARAPRAYDHGDR